ncbi:MAG: DUF4340 domain-containing protein [Acidobacteriota bacterium]
MRPARLIALALVVLGLGAYIYFVERHKPSTDELKERQDKLFPTFEQAKAQKVVVTNSHGRFELVKEKEDWKLVVPLADAANGGAVTGLLSSLAGLKSERTLEAKEVKLADYGLDKPPLSISVTSEGGGEITLKMGAEMPLGNNRAALVGGDKVYLVSKFISTDLDKDLAGWRSNDLAQIYATDVASLTVKDAAARVALAHTGNLWTLTEPIADLAERERADGVVSDIGAAQIKEFLDSPGDLAALGLQPPLVEVTLVRKDNAAPLLLAFGSEREVASAKQRACKRGERVFWVEASAANRAVTALADWRAKKLVSLDTWAADKLELEAGKEKAALERKDGVWKTGSVEVDGDQVSRRLGVLSDLLVVAYDRPKPSGTPSGHVKVTADQGAVIEATFYPGGSDGEAIAVVPGRAGALAVDSARAGELLADVPSLARPKPTPTPAVTPTAAPTATTATPAPASAS